VALCEIVHEVIFNRNKPEFLNRVMTKNLNNKNNCLVNIFTGLKEVKVAIGSELPMEL